MKNLPFLAFAAGLLLAVWGCKQRYFFYEDADFSAHEKRKKATIRAAPAPFRTYFQGQNDSARAVYKFYFCELFDDQEGVRFKDYDLCSRPVDAEGWATVQRVATLVFLADGRAIYATAKADWSAFETARDRRLDLDQNFWQVIETSLSEKAAARLDSLSRRQKLGKKGPLPRRFDRRIDRLRRHAPFTFYRGRYFLEGQSLRVVLEGGALVNYRKAVRLDSLRRWRDPALELEKACPGCGKSCADWRSGCGFWKAQKASGLVTMHLQIGDDGQKMRLDSLEYRDDDLGVDLQKPVKKEIGNIFWQPVFFRLEDSTACAAPALFVGDSLFLPQNPGLQRRRNGLRPPGN